MDNQSGVLTIAHTKQKYVRQAVNLALSIRIHSPGIPIALVTNLPSDELNEIFDRIIEWNFSNTPALISKLSMYEMTPFQETVFIDADCLVLKPLNSIFHYFAWDDFGVFGFNKRHPKWFQEIDLIKKEVPAETYVGFNGGFYYFKKSMSAKKVFELAQSFFSEYDRLKIGYFGNHPGDEPLISLAMAKVGLKAKKNNDIDDIIAAPAGKRGKLEIDVLAGECYFQKHNRIVEPYIMHFASDDSCFEYLREELKLRASYYKYLSKIPVILLTSWAWIKWLLMTFIPLYYFIAKNKIKNT